MKRIAILLTGIALFLTVSVTAQDFEVPTKLPETKEEFVKSEPDFIKAAQWLENTAIDTKSEKREMMNAWVLQWLSNSPTVTIEVLGSLLKPFEKNPSLMIVFMAGYGRYCLENNYSKDALKCNTAGMKSAVNCFNLGGDIKKDKEMSKVTEADKEGKLEEWISETMKKKE